MAKIHGHAMRGEREKAWGGGNMERVKEKECEAGRGEVGQVGGGILAQKE